MLLDELATLFERDLAKLKTEILSYPEPSQIWQTVEGISNSGGNLCLHLLGNTQHFIGHILGKSSYVRDRPAEFSLKNIPAEELTRMIDQASEVVTVTIRSLSDEDMDKQFPENVLGHEMTTRYFLLHLLAHLNYHVGQVNYHRRMIAV